MAKSDKPIGKTELMANVNRWRRLHKKPACGHESPREFRRNFNRVGNQIKEVAHEAKV